MKERETPSLDEIERDSLRDDLSAEEREIILAFLERLALGDLGGKTDPLPYPENYPPRLTPWGE